MTDPLLTPRSLQSAIAFDKAAEILATLQSSNSPDDLGDAIEAAASDADLAQAVIYRLLVVARGWDDAGDTRTGVELVANALHATPDLWLP